MSVSALGLPEKGKPVGPHLLQVETGFSWLSNGEG